MPFEEKYTWVLGILAIVTYPVYLAIMIPRLASTPIGEVEYVDAMLWTIGGSIVASILLTMIVGVFSMKTVGKKDVRDREIHQRGEYIGQGFVVAGALGAMVMAWLKLDYFWIANAIHVSFYLSAILGFIVKVVGYRSGLPRW
jgi:hypothetical protein